MNKVVGLPDTTNDEDEDLIYFFKNFEQILSGGDMDIDKLSAGVDFSVFSEYLINDITRIQDNLEDADDSYLLNVCEHLFNIIDWMNLIVANRSKVFSDAFERVFNQHFGDGHILQTIYDKCLQRWLIGKSGQYKLGVNTYSVLNNNLYYRDRFSDWFLVGKETAFDMQPNRENLNDQNIIKLLERQYTYTTYEILIQRWNDQDYKGVLPENFMQFKKEKTSPEEYFEFTLHHIESLLDNPVSINELERWNGAKIKNLEDTVKLCTLALDVVKDRRRDDSHTIYLLRDCLAFYELHKTLDILSSKVTSFDQLLIGRKMLSHTPDQWGYYIVILEALYVAHKRFPINFQDFYNEFARLLDIFVQENPRFLKVVSEVASYIQKHIKTDKDNVTIFDVGFQGSINLFVKYVIDRHLGKASNLETKIALCVGAEWSKELFGNIASGDYFPFLNRTQMMAINDNLYHYNFGGLKNGEVEVTMGDEHWQHNAAIELVTLVMIAKLDWDKNY